MLIDIVLKLTKHLVDQISQEDIENAFKVLGSGSMNAGELMHTLEVFINI